MITRQLGYTNNFVLEGGLNYWFDNILNPQKPSSTSPDEEFAKYDFRKSAGMASEGWAIQPTDNRFQQHLSLLLNLPGRKRKLRGC
jgi:hypothetical protein